MPGRLERPQNSFLEAFAVLSGVGVSIKGQGYSNEHSIKKAKKV
jgi:hypothetical protein